MALRLFTKFSTISFSDLPWVFQNFVASFSSLELYTKSTRAFSSFSGGMKSSSMKAAMLFTSRVIGVLSLGFTPLGKPCHEYRTATREYGIRVNFACLVNNSSLKIQCEL